MLVTNLCGPETINLAYMAKVSIFSHRFGPLYLDFSPRYVMFSGWVGDDDPTFTGLESALKSYLQSAWAGKCYCPFMIKF